MPARAGWKRDILLLAAFLLVGVVAHFSVLDSWFLSDDFSLIEGVATEGFFSTWGEAPGGFYRPVTVLSYLINHAIFGLTPLGYHLTNVIFHSLNAFLVVLFCRALAELLLARTAEVQPVAIASGFLFLCLPSHSESVSWIAGRTDVIATFFALIALIFFCFYLQRKSWYLLGLGSAALALALFTKESIISVPFILLILVAAFLLRSATRRRDAPRSVLVVASSFLVLIVYLLFRFRVLGVWVGGYGAEVHLNFPPGIILQNFGRALLRVFIPALPASSRHLLVASQAYLIFGLLLVLAIAYVFARRRPPTAEQVISGLVALCSLVCALLPSITLYVDMYSTEGERFLYLPSVFGMILCGHVLRWLLPKQRLYAAASVFLIIAYALSLWRVNTRWVTAGELSKNLTQTIVQSASCDRIVVLNLPDNFRGAYLFRSGFFEAVSTFQDKPRLSLIIASTNNITSLKDEAVLRSGEDRALTLELSSPETHFRWIEEGPPINAQTEGLRAVRFNHSLSLSQWDIFWFTKGEFQLYSRADRPVGYRTPCVETSACFRVTLPLVVK